MEEAMSHTAHSQSGTDDRVKLPNLTEEEVNWQELEDLYSINESLYESRPDYSPGPDDWANFQKDVDHMFALPRLSHRPNKTRTLDDSTLPELGSGAGGGDLSEGSGDNLTPASDDWPVPAAETFLTTPAPRKPPLAPPIAGPTQEGKLGPVLNDLPSSLGMVSSRDGAILRSDVWGQLEELDGEVFSGNGLTELETRHDVLLRTHHSLQGPQGLKLDPGDEEDIFQAQGYLPFSPQTLRPKVPAEPTKNPSTAPQTSAPHSAGVVLQALPPSLDYEGSSALS